MTTLAEVREKYPQYKDLSDEQLAKGLHSKYYSDMPFDQFAAKIGLKAPTPVKSDPTAGERTSAAIGGVNRGLAGLAGLPADTAENIINLGIAAYNVALGRGGESTPPLEGSYGTSKWISDKLQGVGVNTQNPRPDDPASRMLHTGGMIAAAGGRRPLAPAVGGVVAQETLGPEWTGVGAMTPAAASQAATAAKNAVAARVQPRVQQFNEAGVTPSVGQATEANFLQGFENLLSKFPGGQGVFRKFSENQQKQLGSKVATGVSAEDAGRAIEKGVTGFMARTKATWNQLDAEVAAKIPQGTSFSPANTAQVLDDLTRPTPGAEKTTGALVNPKLQQIKDNLTADLSANNGQIPYEALRALRTRVGSMLDDSLTAGVPQGELKKLYGALSKDMETAATQAGAGKEFARQNAFYKARMDRVESVLQRVLGTTPEETFSRFMPKDAEQATRVRAVMRSLDPEQRQMVTDAVVQRLGRATPGKQDASGEVFSPETFLTNWNRLSPGAKAQLFPDTVTRKNMDAIATVTDNLRSGAKVFANPSGTAGATAPYGLGFLLGAAAVDVVQGNVAGAVSKAGTAVAVTGGAAIGAKMMTSPKVVEWLAKSVKATTPEQMTAQLGRLGVIYNETKDEALKAELAEYVTSLR